LYVIVVLYDDIRGGRQGKVGGPGVPLLLPSLLLTLPSSPPSLLFLSSTPFP